MIAMSVAETPSSGMWVLDLYYILHPLAGILFGSQHLFVFVCFFVCVFFFFKYAMRPLQKEIVVGY